MYAGLEPATPPKRPRHNSFQIVYIKRKGWLFMSANRTVLSSADGRFFFCGQRPFFLVDCLHIPLSCIKVLRINPEPPSKPGIAFVSLRLLFRACLFFVFVYLSDKTAADRLIQPRKLDYVRTASQESYRLVLVQLAPRPSPPALQPQWTEAHIRADCNGLSCFLFLPALFLLCSSFFEVVVFLECLS